MSRTLPRRWVVASANRGKLAEIRAILGPDLEVEPQASWGIESPQESGLTFVENALIKARHAAACSGLPAIADDSGLIVPALGGAPGVRSARYAGPQADDAANLRRLLEALRHVAPADRAAEFVCVIVALEAPDDPAPLIACGRWAGGIAMHPAGDNGFGYDPVFMDPELQCTAAQLAPEVKNQVSHRARALHQLRAALARRAGAG